jgi:5-methylcytosine-specific restriction endonuclease McrA
VALGCGSLSTSLATNALGFQDLRGGYPAGLVYLGFKEDAIKACLVETCDKPVKGRGYCAAHYFRLMKWGDVQADKPLRGFHTSSTCAVEICEKPPKAGGYCFAHYKRFKTHGDPLGAREYPKSGPCHIEACDKIANSHGLCDKHLTRYYKYGDPYANFQEERVESTGQCQVEGCTRPDQKKGMCTRHLNSYYKFGDPLKSRRRRRFNDEIAEICSIDGCTRPHVGRGYCGSHYLSIVRHGYMWRDRNYEIRESFMRRLYESPCEVCGVKGDTQADHVIPLGRGGSHCEGNLQPLCRDCNRRKSDRLMIEWKFAKRQDELLNAQGMEATTKESSHKRRIVRATPREMIATSPRNRALKLAKRMENDAK